MGRSQCVYTSGEAAFSFVSRLEDKYGLEHSIGEIGWHEGCEVAIKISKTRHSINKAKVEVEGEILAFQDEAGGEEGYPCILCLPFIPVAS